VIERSHVTPSVVVATLDHLAQQRRLQRPRSCAGCPMAG
jgi:hypothetical protein